MAVSKIQLLIPKNRCFEFDGKGPYLCQQDLIISTAMTWISVKSQGRFFLASQDPDEKPYAALIENICPIVTNNSDLPNVSVMNLGNLGHDYSTDLCLNGQHSMLFNQAKIAPNQKLQFWRITHPEKPFHIANIVYTKMVDFQPDADHEVLRIIPLHELQTDLQSEPKSKRTLCIQKDSIVEFGSARHTTCHNIWLRTDNSIVSSNYRANSLHLDSVVRELTHNPFQNGRLQPDKIQLKSQDGYKFIVGADTFARQITYCMFHSDNLFVTRGGDPITKAYNFMWSKHAAQQKYLQRCILAKMESHNIQDGIDALKFVDTDEFFPKAYTLAVRADNLDLMTDLVAMAAGAKSYVGIQHALRVAMETAIQNGKLEITKYLVSHPETSLTVDNAAMELAVQNGQVDTLRYFIEQGFAINAKSYGDYIQLASEKSHTAMVKYLSQMPQYIEWQKRQLIADIAKLSERLMQFCEVVRQ